MNLKKKIKAFFSFKRRSDGGFTLVELIVVIAILAILAGVGTAGYSGYIKNANKNADKVLVGNIMRAIETGTNSTMFVNGDSFKMGKMAYPVGVITLSSDACSLKESTSTVNKETTECNMVDDTFYKIEKKINEVTYERKKLTGGWTDAMLRGNQEYYELTAVPVRYCSNHTTIPTANTYNTLGAIKYTTHEEFREGIVTYRVKSGNEYTLVSQNNVINYDECVGIYALQDEAAGHGTSITREELEALPSGNRITDSTTGNPLYDSLTAAFGSDLSALKLSYENWTSEEDMSYASANSFMTESYKELLKVADTAANQGLIGWASSAYFGKNWDTPEAAMDEAVRAVTQMYGNNEEAWLAAWANTANEAYNQCGFGMNTGNATSDKVGYNVLRMQYNQAFASYLLTKNVPNEYIDVIVKFDSGVSAGDIYLPAVVNKSAFAVDAAGSNASGLKEKLKNKGDTDGAWFEKIEDYYYEYLESPAYTENAKSIMAVTSTMAENGAAAMKYEGGYKAYFQNYVDEMDAFYTAAENAAGDGIVIIVMVENEKLNFQVSPSTANPRND